MNPFIALRKQAAALEEARQVAEGDPYADLGDVLNAEQSRGLHFERDGARVVNKKDQVAE